LKIDEKKLLRSFAKALGNENLLEELEQKKTKEEALLESMNNALAKLSVGEKKKVEKAFEKPVPLIIEEVPVGVTAPASKQNQPKPIPLGAQPLPQLPQKDFVTKSVEALSQKKRDEYVAAVDEMPNSIRKELDLLKKTVTDLHRFASRASQMGGGGAGDVVNLDHPAKTVSSNYTLTNKDYYIGAGVTPITITLPAVAKNGRVIVIKDEVGNCSQHPITVHGKVDNDAGGFILAENNGGIQMIYNNGSWRII
jgi:hypothetical protein